MQNKLHMLSQAHQSRPGSPAERYRRALPHGKAFTGRGASLLPAWCTAVDLLHGPDALEAAATADGLQVTINAYWRQSSSCCGRPGAALLRRRAEVSGKHRSCHLCHAFTAADGALLGAHAER